jgi:RNA polymerase sigma-70 factor, ECF subfamily
MPSDHELLERFRAGDEDAFEALVARWSTPLLRLAHRLLGDVEEARDVRQQAWIRCVRHTDRLRGDAAVGTWLHRVVVNLCRDRLRARAGSEDAREGLNGRHLELTTPATLAEADDLAVHVAAAVAALPQDEREALVLRHYQDLPFPQVAAVLELPVTTVKSRVTRALQRLESRLAEHRHHA